MCPLTPVSDIFGGAFGKKHQLNAGTNPILCADTRSATVGTRIWGLLNKRGISASF